MFLLTMSSFPSKEQLEKLSNDTKLYQEQMVKTDCDYMLSLMAETFSKALKSKKSELMTHTEIDVNKVSNWSNIRMGACKFGPTNEPIEKVLASSGVELFVTNLSNIKPFMSYDKLRKTFYVHPR
jgi:hypothetical protein